MRIAAIAIAVTALILGATTVPPLAAQGQTSIGVDADPEGNSATTLGAVQDCRSVEVNDSFQIDVFVRDVQDIDGFQFDLVYDSTKVRVTAVDNLQMLNAGGATQAIDFSDQVPDTDGTFTVAVADFGPNNESGDGVLSRITLEALANGQSSADLTNVRLTSNAQPVASFLVFGANIAVGESCTPPPAPVPVSETPDADQETPAADQGTPEPIAGRETPTPPPAALDADEDGAPDANDQCQDTPADASVDPSGCSDTQLENLKEETKEQLVEEATAGLNLDVTLDTVVVGGSTDVLATFADQNDEPVPGVDVTFKIEEQPGSDANLEGEAEVTKTSGADGVAEAKLAVGKTPGEIVVSATAEGETESVTVTVVEAAALGAGTPTAGSPEPDGVTTEPEDATEVTGADDDGGLSTAGWAALGGGLGVAALLLAGAALLWARRRRA